MDHIGWDADDAGLHQVLVPDLNIEILAGAASQSCRGVSDSIRDVLEFSCVGFKIRQLDHVEVEPAVGRFPDLGIESHVSPLRVSDYCRGRLRS